MEGPGNEALGAQRQVKPLPPSDVATFIQVGSGKNGRSHEGRIQSLSKWAGAASTLALDIVKDVVKGRWALAENRYQRALEIYIAFNARFDQASSYHQLGLVAEEQCQWAQAEHYYQRALEIEIAFNDRYHQAVTYHQLGQVAVEQQQWQQARDYLLKPLEIMVEFEDDHELSISLRTLARLWRESGDTELPAAVAGILTVSPREAEKLLRAARKKR